MSGKNWRRVGPNLWYNDAADEWMGLGEDHPLYEGKQAGELDVIRPLGALLEEKGALRDLIGDLTNALVRAGALRAELKNLHAELLDVEILVAKTISDVWDTYNEGR